MRNKVNFEKKVKCPVRWYCKKLHKYMKVSEEAVFHLEYGWICDCGQWVKESDVLHSEMTFDKRNYFTLKK